MANTCLPQNYKLVDALPGIHDTFAAVTCDYISLRHAVMAWIVVLLQQDTGHETYIIPYVATSTTPTGATPITFSTEIWINEDTGASDTLVEQTSAVSAVVAGDIATKMVVIRIDPSNVTAQGVQYDCLGCVIDSSKTLNTTAALYIIQERYAQATPPSVLS